MSNENEEETETETIRLTVISSHQIKNDKEENDDDELCKCVNRHAKMIWFNSPNVHILFIKAVWRIYSLLDCPSVPFVDPASTGCAEPNIMQKLKRK